MKRKTNGIAVEHNIPVPNGSGQHGNVIYPWRQMKKVGDSFLAPLNKRNSLSAIAVTTGRRLGYKFTVRKVSGGVRVWRIK